MRTFNSLALMLIGLFLLPLALTAQTYSEDQAFHIHEDVVSPDKVSEYEQICKKLVSSMKEYNIQDVVWNAASTADGRYIYIQPIENMADLGKYPFASLVEKMGKEAVDNIFDKMDTCYDIEHDYVVRLNQELTYMPDGVSMTQEDQNYRKWHYLHVSPENRSAVKEKMEGIKDLFASKGSEMHYRVYNSGFGTRGEYYIVVVSAKDAVDYAQRSEQNMALLGEEGKKTFDDLFASLLKYEEHVGWMRPDLAYSSDISN